MNIRQLLFISFLIITFRGFSQDEEISFSIDSLGLKQGYWIELEVKPELFSVSHVSLSNGKSIEEFNYSFKNYRIFKYSGNYQDGYRTGLWEVTLFENGEVYYKLHFEKGLISGQFEVYYPNGNLKLTGNIIRTKKTKVTYYDENGKYLKCEEWFTRSLLERLYLR